MPGTAWSEIITPFTMSGGCVISQLTTPTVRPVSLALRMFHSAGTTRSGLA